LIAIPIFTFITPLIIIFLTLELKNNINLIDI
jgi:hypothetical protein